MLNFNSKICYADAFSILTGESSGKKAVDKAKRALKNKFNTPRQYMALVFLCALRGEWGVGDRYAVSFNVLLSVLKGHSFFDEIKSCVCSPYVKKEYERGAVNHNYHALCFLAWAHYYGWGTEKNSLKAKELVSRAKKIGGDIVERDFNDEIFRLIENA